MSNSQLQLTLYAIRLLQENFSISEAASLLSVDYRNMCAYVSGRKEFPLKLAFRLFDYLDCRLVVLRNN